MATTGIVNGTLGLISVGGTVVSHLTNVDVSFEMATRDATTKDSGGDKDVLEGLKSFSGSASGYFAEDATYGFEDLYDAYTARTAVTVLWTSEVSGDVTYSGSAYITSLSRSAGVEESVTFEVSFEGTGSVTKGTVA